MKSIDEMKYRKARRFLANPETVRTKPPAFSFSDETRSELQRLLGPRPELIARLERQVAPGGFVPGPIFAEIRRRRSRNEAQWRKLARAVAVLRASIESLDYGAGIEVDTGGDGRWEFEHQREGPDVDLEEFAAHAERISAVLNWLLPKRENARRGRPRGISDDRAFLGLGAALALQEAGVRLTKGRDGVLARTLSILFDAANLGAPEDMFDSVQDIVRRVHAIARRREGAAERAAAKEVVTTFLENLSARTKALPGTTQPTKARNSRARNPVE